MNNTTQKITRRPMATIVAESFAAGTKLSQNGYMKAGGYFGDYYYRVYVREFNKLQKAKDAEARTQFEASSNALISTLKEQTETLRVEYTTKVADWAKSEFARTEAFIAQNVIVYREKFDSYKAYDAFLTKRNRLALVVERGVEAYVAREVALAEQHYQDSILKLAARIEKKGLNKEALVIKTARVSVNIETTFTDGVKTVRAWTIIASGPCVRPHYRYLIK